jgi:molecular chaperone Hsp33
VDYAVRAMDKRGHVRVFAAVTTGLVGQAAKLHRCSATAAAALGRSLTAAALTGLMLKNDRDRLTLQVLGGGPIGRIVVVANARGEVKGYVDNPAADLPLNAAGKLDVGGVVGKKGQLTIIKDLGLKEPYIGKVDLVSGEIAEDMAAYFTYSEQTPSAVALGVLVDKDLSVRAAGGYLVQLMPGVGEEEAAGIEERLYGIKPVSALIDEGLSPEEILKHVLQDNGLKFLEKRPLSLKCDCSRERLEEVLISLGKEDIRDLLEKEGKAELVCHFCNKKYVFEAEELEGLLGTLS